MSDSSINWNLIKIANAVQGELVGEDKTINGLSTDTRSCVEGELFVALQGPNFDGHNYVEQAEKNGAIAILVSKKISTSLPQIIVNDTRIALGKLANAWRMQFDIPLIAITGSNGKTTVKEITTAILSQEHNVLATKGNFNNDIGVPLTLFGLNSGHSAAVIEMGANHPKEIEYLTHIAKPTVAIITNAGPAHLEGFGDIEGVARAKGEIYSGLSQNGTAIINNDDQYSEYWLSICKGVKTCTFGSVGEADYLVRKENGHVLLTTPGETVNIDYYLPGEHNLLNAAAAAAACSAAGVSIESIKNGLESMQAVSGRLQLKKGISGSRIIDDTYNANPGSLKAALQVLNEYPGTHLLALGDMGELGNAAEHSHTDAGKQARNSGVNKLYAIGQFAQFSAQGFGEDSYVFEDQPSMISEIKNNLAEDVTLLVKGSRLMKMENIVNALAANGES